MWPSIHDELVISISVRHYLLCCSGSRCLLAQSSSRTKYQICFNLTVIEQRQLVDLVSFLLTFNSKPGFLLLTLNMKLPA